MLTGVDCSRHQGTIDWRAVATRHQFAFIKATEGTRYSYVDWFHRNAPQVEAAGLTLGAYHFLRRGAGAGQARYFVSTVGAFPGRVAVLDVEKAYDGTWPTITDVRDFVAEFRRLTSHPLVIYTGGWFWKGYLGNPHGADLGPLWHSEYEGSQAEVDDGPEGDTYGGWPGATFWQWTSSGSCPGVDGRVDLNIFYGSPADLAVLAGRTAAAPATPVQQEDDDMLRVIGVKSSSSRPFMALAQGHVIKFTDNSTLVDTADNEVQESVQDYYDGAGLLHTEVVYVDAGRYDRAAVLAKGRRSPA